MLLGEGIFPNCSIINTGPNVSIKLAGKEFVLTPKDYVLQITQGPETECISGFMGLEYAYLPFFTSFLVYLSR